LPYIILHYLHPRVHSARFDKFANIKFPITGIIIY